MPTAFTSQDITLLGYKQAESIKVTPSFEVFDASTKIGVEDVKTRFIYLKTRCTMEAAKQASLNWTQNKSVCVVRPNSLTLKEDTLRKIFGNDVRLCVQDDLLWEVLEDSFSGYLQHLKEKLPIEEHFISPRSNEKDIGAELFQRLVKYLTGKSKEDEYGTLVVLSANAGVGKTTLSRQLIHRLVKGISTARTIPIFIESQHWQKLRISSVHGLWDVIDNSLRILSGTHLQLNEELFFHALQQGYFSFVFDGFDELCSQGTAQFDPSAVLEELSSIVRSEESLARVLLTTRTLFWDAQISNIPENVKVWSLEAFNSQQAKHYFTKVFGQSTPECANARSLYSELGRQAIPKERTGSVRDQFVNLPLCVSMVVDYVNSGGNMLKSEKDEPVLMTFLKAICDREIHRQGLVTPAVSQMRSFQDMAIGTGVNPEFDIEDLGMTPEGFEEEDLSKTVDHALLKRDGDSKKFEFRYDFVVPFLRAAEISKWIRQDNSNDILFSGTTLSTLIHEIDGKEQVLEQLPNFLENRDIENVMQKGKIAAAKNLAAPLGIKAKYLSSFFFHVAQMLVSSNVQLDKEEKTTLIFSKAFADESENPPYEIRGWGFIGLINGLDLRGIKFAECCFKDVYFKNCVADKSTIFSDCLFEGGLRFEGNRKGWDKVDLDEDCTLKVPASLSWEVMLNRKLSDSRDRVLHILRFTLSKFWHHGTIRFSLSMNNWNTGPVAQTGSSKQVLDVMLKQGLLSKIRISGVKEGGLAFDRESIRDLQNFMDNSQLSGKIEAVYLNLI